MLNDYRALAIFLAVAESGSFTKAGKALKLSTSVVSHNISKLEEETGASLFFRSPRAVTITAAGLSVLATAQEMVEAGNRAIDILTDQSEQLAGSLRVTFPAFGNQTQLHKLIWEFCKQHPAVDVTLSSTDRQEDIVDEGIDVAIRHGELTNSSLKCRRVADFSRTLVASPDYIEKVGSVRSISDLKKCDFVSISIISKFITLNNGQDQAIFEPENSRIVVDSITTAKCAILEGLGVQHLPSSEVEKELQSGELIHILPDWAPPILGIYAVWSETGHSKRITRTFIDYLIQMEKSNLDKIEPLL